MEANKLECEKCIKIAQTASANGDKERAIKFLRKSLQLYPSETAKSLLENLLKSKSSDNLNDDGSNDSNSDATDSSKAKPQQQQQSPNLNRRKFSTNEQNTNNSSSTQQSASSSSTTNKPKDYTPDQIDAVKRIKNCKDFYEMLGVPKSATEADLKKQYKKLALQFHPDKNKAPGATEAFKAIGKAFAILNDAQKRKHYDLYGPESFESSSNRSASRRTTQSNMYHSNSYTNNYWNDDEFSAEEIFNMFFGAGFGNNAAAHRHSRHHSAQSNFVFTQNNNYALLFQLMPILMIVVLSLLSSFMMGEPLYSLHKTNKFNVKRITIDHKVPYYVKPDFRYDTTSELNRLERQIEEDLLVELRQSCFREKSYKETAIWRARNYGDEKLIKKAFEIDTPSCDKINSIFSGG